MGGSTSTPQISELENTEDIVSKYNNGIWRERLTDHVYGSRDSINRQMNQKICCDYVDKTVIKQCKELETVEKNTCSWDD